MPPALRVPRGGVVMPKVRSTRKRTVWDPQSGTFCPAAARTAPPPVLPPLYDSMDADNFQGLVRPD